jgi:hypothetical protein
LERGNETLSPVPDFYYEMITLFQDSGGLKTLLPAPQKHPCYTQRNYIFILSINYSCQHFMKIVNNIIGASAIHQGLQDVTQAIKLDSPEL